MAVTIYKNTKQTNKQKSIVRVPIQNLIHYDYNACYLCYLSLTVHQSLYQPSQQVQPNEKEMTNLSDGCRYHDRSKEENEITRSLWGVKQGEHQRGPWLDCFKRRDLSFKGIQNTSLMDVSDPTGFRAFLKVSEQSHVVASGSLQPRNYFNVGHIFGTWFITMSKCRVDVESIPGSHYILKTNNQTNKNPP